MEPLRCALKLLMKEEEAKHLRFRKARHIRAKYKRINRRVVEFLDVASPNASVFAALTVETANEVSVTVGVAGVVETLLALHKSSN